MRAIARRLQKLEEDFERRKSPDDGNDLLTNFRLKAEATNSCSWLPALAGRGLQKLPPEGGASRTLAERQVTGGESQKCCGGIWFQFCGNLHASTVLMLTYTSAVAVSNRPRRGPCPGEPRAARRRKRPRPAAAKRGQAGQGRGRAAGLGPAGGRRRRHARGRGPGDDLVGSRRARCARILADLGDRVTAGQVLIELDSEKQQYTYEQQQAALARTLAQYGAPDPQHLPDIEKTPDVAEGQRRARAGHAGVRSRERAVQADAHLAAGARRRADRGCNRSGRATTRRCRTPRTCAPASRRPKPP